MQTYHYHCFTEFKPGQQHHFDGVLTTDLCVTAENYAAFKAQLALQTGLRTTGEKLILTSLTALPSTAGPVTAPTKQRA